MTFTHALSTNNYSPAKFIVSASAAEGTHTTIAAALTSASSGDTIFIRPGTYTENITLKAGVNLTAYVCDAETPNVTISGTCTLTAAGTVTISGIRLQTNASFLLAVTGSNASIVNLIHCYLNCTNNTGISFTTSSSSARINITDCSGNLGTTGIGLFSSSSAGVMRILRSIFTNSGASTTATTCSAGTILNDYSIYAFPFSTSSTGIMNFTYCNINTSAQNATCFTTAGTGSGDIEFTDFVSGTASSISIGAGTTVRTTNLCRCDSSNTNVITGAGTLSYGYFTFSGASNGINTTTQTGLVTRKGIDASTRQPAFLATHTVAQNNVTGAGTLVTVNFTTEIFDQNANYDATNTFTAPYTGRYHFSWAVYVNDATTSNFGLVQLATSNRVYLTSATAPFPLVTLNQYQLCGSILADMDAADTAVVQVNINGMAGNTADIPIAAEQTFFSGYLEC